MPVMEKQTWQFALTYDVNVLKTLKVGTESLDERNRRRITHSLMLESGYSFTNRLSADLFLPFIRQERKIINPGFQDDFQSTHGIGDMVLLVKYNIINKGPVSWSLGIGPKFPTGASDITRNGILLGADLQPGSGAWDGILWSYLVHQLQARKSMSITLVGNYRHTGTNDEFRPNQSYRFGRDFQLITGIADRFVIGKLLVDPSISFRYRKAGQDQAADFDLPNTGGEWIFLNPTVVLSANSKLSFNFGFEIPLYANITGTQLTPTYRLTTGIYYSLGQNQNELLAPIKE